MSVTEAGVSRIDGDGAGGPVYDAFISYSHAADDLLAPRLHAALQRFAKPWWKRRALRIFRDEASLAANPHLWGSITDALDDSAWFVLLMSPEAARSEWVNKEVEYWLEHRDPERIIPVLTDGEFAWVDGDVVSDAAPPALVGALPDEPRWVDLRFARSEEQLDLNNAGFRAAVADIASALRGLPKDELESEEVRQHRRTIRTAWAAGVGLLVLALLAGGAAFYASAQRDEIAQQRDEIAQQRDEIVEQRDLAQQSEAQAVAFAAQLLDFVNQRKATDSPSDGIVADFGPGSHSYHTSPPDSVRLDFLQETCSAGGCTRDASFVDEQAAIRTGPWHAYEPFHIRHGFVNTEPPGERGPTAVSVLVYVRRDEGPELEDGAFPLDQWYRYLPDYVVRETTDRCGPGYRDQIEPIECDRYVHDFPDGLPPGRYTFFVEWRAPCLNWFGESVCDRPLDIVSLFDSQVNSPFLHETYEESPYLTWPHELWGNAEPIP